jgi:hypothetical protein
MVAQSTGDCLDIRSSPLAVGTWECGKDQSNQVWTVVVAVIFAVRLSDVAVSTSLSAKPAIPLLYNTRVQAWAYDSDTQLMIDVSRDDSASSDHEGQCLTVSI